MDRLQFLEKIFLFYGKEQNPKNRELLKDYDLALSTQKRVDWQKLYEKVIKESETKYLPMPKWFISKFDYCLLPAEEGTYKIDGGKGILTLKDRRYEYDMSHCPWLLGEIRAKFRERFKGNYVSFEYFPLEA